MGKTLSQQGQQGAAVLTASLNKMKRSLVDQSSTAPLVNFTKPLESIQESGVIAASFIPTQISVLKSIDELMNTIGNNADIIAKKVRDLYIKNSDAAALEKQAEAKMADYEASVKGESSFDMNI